MMGELIFFCLLKEMNMKISVKKINVSELYVVKENQRKVKENEPKNKTSAVFQLVWCTIHSS